MSISELSHELQIAFINLEIKFKDEKVIDDLNESSQEGEERISDATGSALHRLMDRIPAQM